MCHQAACENCLSETQRPSACRDAAGCKIPSNLCCPVAPPIGLQHERLMESLHELKSSGLLCLCLEGSLRSVTRLGSRLLTCFAESETNFIYLTFHVPYGEGIIPMVPRDIVFPEILCCDPIDSP